MQVKQHRLSAFFIQAFEEQELERYIDKNAPLLKGHLLVFQSDVSENIKKRLANWGLSFIVDKESLKPRTQKEKRATKEPIKSQEVKKMELIYEDIRSGRELYSKGDLLIRGHIKDGAFIESEGNLLIFGIIEGDISCKGTYLILRNCKRGKVLFQGSDIKHLLKGEALKIIYKEHEEIKVKELE